MKIGDKVVYPMHGAGEITGMEEDEVGGVISSYYVFHLPVGNMKLMLPVDKLNELGLRDLIKPAQLDEVIEVLKAETEPFQGSWNKRFQMNNLILNLKELEKEKTKPTTSKKEGNSKYQSRNKTGNRKTIGKKTMKLGVSFFFFNKQNWQSFS